MRPSVPRSRHGTPEAKRQAKLAFLADQNMVEPVVDLLTGHGHKVTRVRDAGLATDDDAVVAEYALSFDLVVVTFDYDLRNRAVRGGAACLHIPPPERTAYARLQDHYSALADLLKGAPHSLVVLPRDGPPYIA